LRWFGGSAGKLPYSDCWLAQSRAAEGVWCVCAPRNEIARTPKLKKNHLAVVWWKCGELNPGPPVLNRHFLHV